MIRSAKINSKSLPKTREKEKTKSSVEGMKSKKSKKVVKENTQKKINKKQK